MRWPWKRRLVPQPLPAQLVGVGTTRGIAKQGLEKEAEKLGDPRAPLGLPVELQQGALAQGHIEPYEGPPVVLSAKAVEAFGT